METETPTSPPPSVPSGPPLDLHEALVSIARHEDSRMCLVLLGAILDNPGLAERLLQVLKPPAERSRRNDVD